MAERLTLRLLALSVVHSVACSHMFFHEPSAILVNQSSDFGFALSHWNDSLIISSPSSDVYGKVYRCPLAGISAKSLSCSSLDLFNSTTYTRDVYPDQNFCLGASIAATNDYLFTCAPLVTKNITTVDDYGDETTYSDAVGSCFIHYNDVSNEYLGPESIFKSGGVNNEIFEGGTGWNTLLDEDNGFLLVAKTSVYGDIFYLNISDPTQLSQAVDLSSISYNVLDVGYGMTTGKFFSNKTVYAFSKQTMEMTGQIVFLKVTESRLELMVENEECTIESCIYTIDNKVVGAMFGYALGSVDLDSDGFSELLVGAPLQSEDDLEVEYGALYIYFGGNIESLNDHNRIRIIFGTKAMGRFGSTIATSDIDGDGIPEVFVSAPYEDSGVVYVLSGRELKEELMTPSSSLTMQVSELKHSQRVVRDGFHLLGFSLLTVPDVDGNGCNELAIGAPGAGSALLLRCLPTISVNVTYEISGSYVKESATSCTVKVCFDIGINTKSNKISRDLLVTNYITGAANVLDISRNFKMAVSGNSQGCRGVIITFTIHEQNDYELTTKLELKTDKPLESEDFDETWAQLSPYTKTTNTFRIHRQCKDEDCIPKLSVQIKWNHTEPAVKDSKGVVRRYDVASSTEQMISIDVVNEGFSVFEACVLLEITGAPVHKPGKCSPVSPNGYECMLPTPFRRTDVTHPEKATFDILLNMSSISYEDKALVVVARPYDNCNNKVENYVPETLKIGYTFKRAWDKVHVIGKNNNLTVSDLEISEEELKKNEENTLKDEHQYLITNEGSVLWTTSVAVIEVEIKPFITKVSTTEKSCLESSIENLHKFTCSLTLPPSTVKKETPIMVLVEMSKRKVGEELNGGRLINVTSKIQIFMDFRENTYIETSLVTDIQLKQETSFGHHKNLIGLVAAILALVLLFLVIFCLYKKGFFKRKQKEKLNVLRESVRRRSLRLTSEKSSRASQKSPSSADDDGDHIDIEVVEDPFEEIPINSKDNVVLIEAEVHHEEDKKGENKEKNEEKKEIKEEKEKKEENKEEHDKKA